MFGKQTADRFDKDGLGLGKVRSAFALKRFFCHQQRSAMFLGFGLDSIH